MSPYTKALIFAATEHDGQFRKGGLIPYITHPVEVSNIVARHGGTTAMIQAALLHDVIEDCGVTYIQLVHRFGEPVAGLVQDLTDPPSNLPRSERKALTRERLAGCGAETQTIKLADILANVPGITAADPRFAYTYMEEQDRLFNVLTKGDQVLRARVLSALRIERIKLHNHVERTQ